ncbi:hypothetical protein DVH05_009296 [Phytophthora capsici]|nr:hypothetical protein DVH05_009296 [Phytophthora capsici]
MARKKDAAKMKQLLAEAEEHMKQGLAAQQQKFNKELEKQMDFAQNLVSEKVEFVVALSYAGHVDISRALEFNSLNWRNDAMSW